MKYLIILMITLLNIEQAYSAGWRMRAREHYEIHNVEYNETLSAEYRGLSNTINLWYEEPLEWAFGLAAGPVIGSAKNVQDNLVSELGKSIQLFNVGLELKYFPWRSLPGLFTRLGTGWNQLKSNGTIKTSDGWSLYTGIGWEYPFKYFSIACEVAMRNTYLENDIIILSFTPSIGIHFYNLF